MLKKIAVEHLRVGMYVHELCGSWMDHPFWKTRFELDDPEDIRRLRESAVRDVWIDTAKGLDAALHETRAQASDDADMAAQADQALIQATESEIAPRKLAMTEELARAARICARSKDAMVSMFQEVRMGLAVSPKFAGTLVEEISSSVERNPGALISLARLRSADDYTYMHSVAVCALMVALSRQLEFDVATTRELGMAGLLHDLGKAAVPLEILNKPGKLTDEEFAIMKRHSADGHRMLLESGALGEIPLDVVLHHHEKSDASGYPDRLGAPQISVYAKMGAVCDVYDAITSHRPYKSGWDPAEALRRMADWCAGHFDEHVFQAFVKCIGIYPIGSLVRLESGRLGVVMDQSGDSLLTPKVKVFFSTRSRTYIAPEVLDLAHPSARDKIVGREDAAKWGLRDTDRLWAP